MRIPEGETRVSFARRGMRVRGTVQGVGMRPAVCRLARQAKLGGYVRNDSEGVWIEVEGDPRSLAGFAESLRRGAPALARIESIEVVEVAPRGEREFHVLESAAGEVTRAVVPADSATCDACLAELLDPGNRRFRYPFINCVDCGPRFTIVRDVPYDRRRTTMSAFAMCEACLAEYHDPGNRRFHAEANACADCGPRVSLAERGQAVASGDQAMRVAATRLGVGAIVAVKGLGGYQLAVDARDEDAVARLRARKRRPHKPFALMVRDLATARMLVRLEPAAREALLAPARPIVLVARANGAAVASSVAPGLDELGVMLPATPLHHLLLRDGPSVLVMTSGNLAEEPIARDEVEAERLASLADLQLRHDRPIHTRADDSVVRVVAGENQVVRRARGFVPVPISMGTDAPCVLAVGPHLKSTVCVTRGGDAFVSQHIGDLDSLEAREFFAEAIAKLSKLLGVVPQVVAHDLHPEYASTRWALDAGIPRIAVQHHHAHVASCMAEHARTDAVIGVAFDGTGCSPQGELWGGEFLLADRARFWRLGHLRPIAMAGGEAAVREPWRLGVAALRDAGVPPDVLGGVQAGRLSTVLRMLEQRVSILEATGAGRWFDAVAAIVGLRQTVSYEGQAAIELEALARGAGLPYPFVVADAPGTPFAVDLRPTIRAIADDVRDRVSAAQVSARFHATLAAAVVEGCRRVRAAHDVHVVVLTGGCFQNRLLTEQARDGLAAEGFDVLLHRLVPPNDGGVSLGQAVVAARRLQEGDRIACASASPVRSWSFGTGRACASPGSDSAGSRAKSASNT